MHEIKIDNPPPPHKSTTPTPQQKTTSRTYTNPQFDFYFPAISVWSRPAVQRRRWRPTTKNTTFWVCSQDDQTNIKKKLQTFLHETHQSTDMCGCSHTQNTVSSTNIPLYHQYNNSITRYVQWVEYINDILIGPFAMNVFYSLQSIIETHWIYAQSLFAYLPLRHTRSLSLSSYQCINIKRICKHKMRQNCSNKISLYCCCWSCIMSTMFYMIDNFF